MVSPQILVLVTHFFWVVQVRVPPPELKIVNINHYGKNIKTFS